MKVTEYLTSNIIRLVNDEQSDNQKKPHIGDLVTGLKDRYKFLQVPVKLEEYNLQTGMEFAQGIFREHQIIEKFKVYNNGIYCEAALPTEVISEFVDDVFDWARKNLGMTLEETDTPQAFISHLEVKSDPSIAHALIKFSTIGDMLTEFLASYGQVAGAFEATRLGFHCDKSNVDGFRPMNFSFERRTGQPFDAGIYYSVAPLRTVDHLKVLDELEKILAS